MEELIKTEVKIPIGKYIVFEDGRFYLTPDASNTIYRVKEIICSYSGAGEWCNEFFCSLIDLYCGGSPFNYALGTVNHKREIPEIWKTNAESVITWLERISNKEWFIKCVESFEFVFDNLPVNE